MRFDLKDKRLKAFSKSKKTYCYLCNKWKEMLKHTHSIVDKTLPS